MFPPPRPWKQIGPVEPEREYVAFTSRFFMRSPLTVPSFVRYGSAIGKQIDSTPGVIGWSLWANLRKLEFHTLSAWEDAESLRAFVSAGAHGGGVEKFAGVMRRDSIFVQYGVLGKNLPLAWDDAIARQEAQLARAGS